MRWLAPPSCIPFSSLKRSIGAKKRLAPSCQSGAPRAFKRYFALSESSCSNTESICPGGKVAGWTNRATGPPPSLLCSKALPPHTVGHTERRVWLLACDPLVVDTFPSHLDLGLVFAQQRLGAGSRLQDEPPPPGGCPLFSKKSLVRNRG